MFASLRSGFGKFRNPPLAQLPAWAGCGLLGSLFTPGLAEAQSAPAASGAQKAEQQIVVTGERPAATTTIDKRSYQVNRDLQGVTGSIGDVLRNIPSVDVDLNGNVTLRGQSNVTILVDGRPTSLFQGIGGGQTLLQVPANQYERVEVMTNPSAAFSAAGTGGIINLVTRRNRAPGLSGTVRANFGTRGRRSASGSISDKVGKVELSANFTWRGDPQFSTNRNRFEFFDASGNPTLTSREVTKGVGDLHLWTARASADYALSDRSQLAAEFHHTTFDYHSNMSSQLVGTDLSGLVARRFERNGFLLQNRSDSEGSLSYRQDFTKTRKLTASLTYEATLEDNQQRFQSVDILPPAPAGFENVTRRNLYHRIESKSDYSNDAANGNLQAGYDVEINSDRFVDLSGFGPDAESAAVPDPRLSETVHFNRTVAAVYATYAKDFGKASAEVGLRAEAARDTLASSSGSFQRRSSDFDIFPSIHSEYRLGGEDTLRASLSTRITRPDAIDLDPFRRFVDPFHFTAGNPDLKNQRTISAEAGFEHARGKSLDGVTFYYRRSRHGVTHISTDLGNGVLLTEEANLIGSRAAGAEIIFNGRLTRTINYRLSGNIYNLEIDARNLGLGTRSAWIESGKAGLDWQPDKKDFFQASFTLAGKRLVAQGEIKPMLLVNVGYRHQISRRLWAFVTAQDALHTYQEHGLVQTPTLVDRSDASAKTQAAFVGLSMNFGGGKAKDPNFDYSG